MKMGSWKLEFGNGEWLGLVLLCAMFVGCAGVPKLKLQVPVVKESPKVYGLYGLYLTTDQQQMNGIEKSSAKLSVGESIIVYARGCSDTAEWFVLPENVVVNWKPNREVEVTPTVGHSVSMKLISPLEGGTATFVYAITTDQNGKKVKEIFTVEMK